MDEKNITDRRLTDEEYDNLGKLLTSKDEQDKIVGLNCINNLDLEKTAVQVAFLRKEYNDNTYLWQNNANKVEKYQKSILKDTSFGSIYDYIKTSKEYQIEDIEFYLKRFSVFIKNNMLQYFPFMEDINLTIKFKENDKEIGTTS